MPANCVFASMPPCDSAWPKTVCSEVLAKRANLSEIRASHLRSTASPNRAALSLAAVSVEPFKNLAVIVQFEFPGHHGGELLVGIVREI